MADAAFGRILLKLSGEALMGDLPYGTDPARVASIASQIKGVHDRGVEVAIVQGAGNIFRGLQAATSQGMKTLRQNALQKVIDGVTTIEEVLRVTLG